MTPETEVIGPIRDVQNEGADVVPLPERVREYIRASKAENTLRGYQSDWRTSARGVSPGAWARYRRHPKPSRPTSRSVPDA